MVMWGFGANIECLFVSKIWRVLINNHNTNVLINNHNTNQTSGFKMV